MIISKIEKHYEEEIVTKDFRIIKLRTVLHGDIKVYTDTGVSIETYMDKESKELFEEAKRLTKKDIDETIRIMENGGT